MYVYFISRRMNSKIVINSNSCQNDFREHWNFMIMWLRWRWPDVMKPFENPIYTIP